MERTGSRLDGWYPCKQRREHRKTEREGHVKAEAAGIVQPQDKEARNPPGATRSKKVFSPRAGGGSMVQPTLCGLLASSVREYISFLELLLKYT